MVNEAEKYKEDEEAAACIQSKNRLETYANNLRNSLNDNNLKDNFDMADKTMCEADKRHNLMVVQTCNNWIVKYNCF